MGRDHLSARTIRGLAREVAQRERVRFPPLRVSFPTGKRHPDDYASWSMGPPAWEGLLLMLARASRALGGHGAKMAQLERRSRRVHIRIYRGEPLPLQRFALQHELTEIARTLKGQSVGSAHRAAQSQERRLLARLPYRTRQGQPYKYALPLMRREQRPAQSGGSTFWDKLLGGR
jgi:hypothetical protein